VDTQRTYNLRSDILTNTSNLYYVENKKGPKHTMLHVAVDNSPKINVVDFKPAKPSSLNEYLNSAVDECLSRKGEGKLRSNRYVFSDRP